MKYKIEKGSALFDQLQEIRHRMIACNKAAQDLRVELGAKAVATRGDNIAGGIDALEFEDRPSDWKVIGKPWQKLYYPKAKLKGVIEKIKALPVVKSSEVATLLDFKSQAISRQGDLLMVGCPRTIWRKDLVLVDMPSECKYSPVDGMIEILDSEFEELKKLEE
jgi:hypothetical protein